MFSTVRTLQPLLLLREITPSCHARARSTDDTRTVRSVLPSPRNIGIRCLMYCRFVTSIPASRQHGCWCWLTGASTHTGNQPAPLSAAV
jgi:hypothetical protein